MAEPDHITLETGGKIVLEGDTDHLILETSDTGVHPAGGGASLIGITEITDLTDILL